MSEVEIEYASFLELILLTASITDWFFKTVQKVFTPKKKVHLSLQVLICLKNYLKIDVNVLHKGLTEHFRAAIINLDSVQA